MSRGDSGKSAERTAPRRLRVLIIEDSREDAALVGHALGRSEEPSFEFVTAGSVEEARSHLWRRFDAVLLDLALPDSHGLRTLRHIQGAAPRVPIVVLSRADDPELVSRCIEWGASDFPVKGRAGASEMLDALTAAVERGRLGADGP